jgi:hypothetical protein
MDVKMKLDWYLKWFATFTLITGAILTSLDVRPLNIWMFNIANVSWILVGILWKEWSLIVMNSVLVAIYCYGLWFTFG